MIHCLLEFLSSMCQSFISFISILVVWHLIQPNALIFHQFYKLPVAFYQLNLIACSTVWTLGLWYRISTDLLSYQSEFYLTSVCRRKPLQFHYWRCHCISQLKLKINGFVFVFMGMVPLAWCNRKAYCDLQFCFIGP